MYKFILISLFKKFIFIKFNKVKKKKKKGNSSTIKKKKKKEQRHLV